ncbi:MAG: sigma 54-interacting transcriptional regulator [Byssovorax sp.]
MSILPDHGSDTSGTETFSTDVAEARPRDAGPLIALVIQHPGGTEIAALHPGASLILGRAPGRGLRIDHTTLSREHARFQLVGGRVVVEDLGSKNGVLLDEKRVQRAEIDVGAEVVLGAVRVRVQALGHQGQELGIDGEDRFRRRVEEEIVRTAQFRRPFGLLLLRAVDTRAGAEIQSPGTAWIDEVRSRLRPVDRIALYGPNAVQILLPEMGLDAAEHLARSLTKPLAALGVRLCAGLAMHAGGDDGADVLIERSRQAAHRASPEHPVEIAPQEAWLLGGEGERALRPDVVVGGHMRELLRDAERVASSRIPVILHGETGTGKEVLARLIHEGGPRKSRRMVRVNCGAIPRDLVESTLFGHERGAFTGALQQQKGVFEEADGGTVFLDEIGELPLAAQAALLRVLETGTFSRVGSIREVTVDVRIVVATHRDLEAMSLTGTFRADLFYRLGGVTLEIAPLRDRSEDVEPLALRFLRLANESNGRAVQGIAADALQLLRAYAWPGNVRELRNAVERAVVVTRGTLIGATDLPVRVREARGSSPTSMPVPARAPSAPDSAELSGPVRGTVRDYEASKLREGLEAAGWNRIEAAQKLEIPVRTLSYRMKVLGLKKPGV